MSEAQVQAEVDLVEDNSTILSDPEISRIPIFADGNDKKFRKFSGSDGREWVIAEYKKPVSANYLRAAVLQQNILHLLIPNYFVLSINHSQLSQDGTARFITSFVDNIDWDKSLNTTGKGWSATKTAGYVAKVKQEPQFQSLVHTFTKLGLIPITDNEYDKSDLNELAAATLFDTDGNIISVDVMKPTTSYSFGEEKISRSFLIPEEVRQIAAELGLSEEVEAMLNEYLEVTQELIREEGNEKN
ncbi:MAG: hypothetical protein GW925_01450 [Candidatus Pacebacteria bacterium]|nr:hypothetical protein [Candidatus Paceibacterota bacterium]